MAVPAMILLSIRIQGSHTAYCELAQYMCLELLTVCWSIMVNIEDFSVTLG